MEGIDRLHGIQVYTEFNQKAPHPIVPDSLKLEVVSGLANSSAFTTYYNTLDFSFWSSLEQDSVAYFNSNLFQNKGKFWCTHSVAKILINLGLLSH